MEYVSKWRFTVEEEIAQQITHLKEFANTISITKIQRKKDLSI